MRTRFGLTNPCALPTFEAATARLRGSDSEEDRAVLQPSNGIAIGRRKAGDSFDFHARYGRTLHAQAARESLDLLLALFRSRRRRPSRRPWAVVWPDGEPSRCGRP